jgi:hypothetical protein
LAVVLAVLCANTPAKASVFGEENVTLGAILTEIMMQSKDIAETAYYLKEGFGVAQDTMQLLADATGAVKNVALIVKNPAEFAQWAYRSWLAAFPPLREIRRHVESIQGSVRQLKSVDWEHWTPGAFAAVVNDLRDMEGRAYRITLHSEDMFGVVASKEEMHGAITRDHERAVKTLNELSGWISGKRLGHKEAAVSSAKSDAVAAVNAARSAAALHELATQQEHEFMVNYYRHLKSEDDFTRSLSLPSRFGDVRLRHHGEPW